MKTRTVEIFYFDAGGGHRNAMQALSRQIGKTYPDWTVVPVDLQKLLEPIDPVYRLTKRVTGSIKRLLKPVAPDLDIEPIQAQEIYNTALRRGVTHGLGTILPILQAYIRRYSGEIETLLAARWQTAERRPDLVVSVIPNFNAVMFDALRQVSETIPYVTVMTDMVDCPPHFWMEDQDQVMICGTTKAFGQALATGFYGRANVFEVSGMILKESFYAPANEDRPSRQSLGLAKDRPVALIMFGGNGSYQATQTILEQLAASDSKPQSIVLCGKNAKLLESLADKPGCHAVGFTNNVADYMRLADFFIGKPGPGSISEAIHMGCPVIVEGNAGTMPQERPNLDWIVDNGVGIVVKSFARDIAAATDAMLAELPRFQANILKNIPENRAVFEIVDLLAEILERPATPAVRHNRQRQPTKRYPYWPAGTLLRKYRKPRR
ncbi:glycosyltransferase [Rhizobium alvei]|uniref:Glycosyltransferase n=1 Tax=Rhizobium alvei TaxID=1132659 RepID=A0ABT8YJE7_9HYPH|nr:glycosyltransferase [Rhizobium alvei]MDO6963768.1 glycosyltransferase [Rhizobium alvei]